VHAGYSITTRRDSQSVSDSLSATISQYFIGSMMPDSANLVQQSVIEIRSFKGDWQCYEGPGVQPYWTGDTAKEIAARRRSSIHYCFRANFLAEHFA